jgi:hypothetical protein
MSPLSPLPSTTNLNTLISAETSAVNTAAAAVTAGTAAAAKLGDLRKQLDAVIALRDQYTQEMTDGGNRLIAAQTAAGHLATDVTQFKTSVVDAITAAAPGGLANVPWKGVVTASLSFTGAGGAAVTGAYGDFLGKKKTADNDLATKTTAAMAKRIAVDNARELLDVALSALTDFLTGVESDLATAIQFFQTAATEMSARHTASAWWAWWLGDALVTNIVAADDTALMQKLHDALETWAQDVTDWNSAVADVVGAKAAQASAAYNLAIADTKVRQGLAATAPR